MTRDEQVFVANMMTKNCVTNLRTDRSSWSAEYRKTVRQIFTGTETLGQQNKAFKRPLINVM
jgi:hypothetical protein